MHKRSRPLTAVAAVVVLAAATAAHAVPGFFCEDWGCGMNGTEVSGIALPGLPLQNIRLDRSAVSLVSGDRQEPLARISGRCEDWGCGTNGIWRNGVAMQGLKTYGLRLHGARVALPAAK